MKESSEFPMFFFRFSDPTGTITLFLIYVYVSLDIVADSDTKQIRKITADLKALKTQAIRLRSRLEFEDERGSSGSHVKPGKFRRDGDLGAKMAELIKVREELKRAKDNAMESWLDSKPLIDELEKLQAGLASAKNRISMSNVVISELKSQLEATDSSIKLKVEGEAEANKDLNEITCALDEVKEELEATQIEIGRERRARSKLKQVWRMKRQKRKTLQLTLRAVRIETEAFRSSTDEAIRYTNASEMDFNDYGSAVEVTQQEYYSLPRRAKEETALAQWRVSVSMEQKRAAEASRNSALSRLKDVYSESMVSRRKESEAEEEKEKVPEEVGEEARSDPTETLPRIRVSHTEEPDGRNPRREKGTRRSRSSTKGGKKLAREEEVSPFGKLMKCLLCCASEKKL